MTFNRTLQFVSNFLLTIFILFAAWGLGFILFSGQWRLLPLEVIFIYLILPMKHPCDYNGYSAWWADRKNWIRKDENAVRR